MEIQNTNGKYLIYEDGKIWSKKHKKFLKSYLSNSGYYRTCLSVDNKKSRVSNHRLVAQHYLPNPDNKSFVDHIDRDRTNNNINNLRWVTSSENSLNRRVTGKIPFRQIYKQFNKSNNITYWIINIRKNKKVLFLKHFDITKYSLEEVVRFRNEKYLEFGIDIDDN